MSKREEEVVVEVLPPVTAEQALTILSDEDKIKSWLDDVAIRLQHEAEQHDATTVKGRKALASLAYSVSRTKTAIDAVGKDSVAEAKAKIKAIDANRKLMRDGLDAIQEETRRPVTEWEQAEADRQQRVRDAETRIATCRSSIETGNVESMALALEKLEQMSFANVVLGKDQERIVQLANEAYTAIEDAHIKAKELEQLRKEKAEREEAERKKAEEAAQKAREEEIARKAREDAIREEKARQEAAEKARIEAEQAERDRIAREQAEQEAKKQAEAEAAERQRQAEQLAREQAIREEAERKARAQAEKEQREREAEAKAKQKAAIEKRKTLIQHEIACDISHAATGKKTNEPGEASVQIAKAIMAGEIKWVRVTSEG